jgi:hypothetical protein
MPRGDVKVTDSEDDDVVLKLQVGYDGRCEAVASKCWRV